MRSQAATAESERRGSDRFTHSSSVLYRAENPTFRKAVCCDFGSQGARLSLPESLPNGSRVALNLRLPDLSVGKVARVLSVEATVVWSKPILQGSEIGVTFQGGGCPADERRLRSWLHSQVLVNRSRL